MTKSTVMFYISFIGLSLCKKKKHNKIWIMKMHFSIWHFNDQNSLKTKNMKKIFNINFFQIFFFWVRFNLTKTHTKNCRIWSSSSTGTSTLNIEKMLAKSPLLSTFRPSKRIWNYASNPNYRYFQAVNIMFFML